MSKKSEAKRKYVAKTTGDRWDDGVKDGGKENWAKKTGEYYEVTVGAESKKNYADGVSGKKEEYEAATDGKAFDKMFKNAARGLQR